MATSTNFVKDTTLYIPPNKQYNTRMSSVILTVTALIPYIITALAALFFLIFLIEGINDFISSQVQYQQYAANYASDKQLFILKETEKGISVDKALASWNSNHPFVPSYTKIINGNAVPFDPTQALRYSLLWFSITILLFWLTRKILRTYGMKRVTLSDEGIRGEEFRILKFIKTLGRDPYLQKYFVPWVGVLDIVVKKSESMLTVFSSKAKKIVIYTMDASIDLESYIYKDGLGLANELDEFSHSLEEKVLDFGYGAFLAVVWRRMKRSRVGVLGIILVLFFSFVGLVAAILLIVYPLTNLQIRTQEVIQDFFTLNIQGIIKIDFKIWNPNYPNTPIKNKAPSGAHWFGTDYLGRDIFARIFFGTFFSILIGFFGTVLSVVIGGIVGAASGYLGGMFDNISMRIADVLMVLPGIPILIMISASFGPIFSLIPIEGAYYLVVFGIFSLIGWSSVARYTRSEVLALKEAEFIQAERVLGASHMRIIMKHILPNTMSTLIIIFTLGVAGTIQSVASLAYLGFGSQSTLVWGNDLSDYTNDPAVIYGGVWWGVTFVSLVLFLLTLGYNLMGDALRDALDPRLKE